LRRRIANSPFSNFCSNSTPEHVFRAARLVTDFDVADQIDELPQPLLVECRASVVLRQHTPERRVVPLDPGHRIVHD
jgi:hypothetical protein